MSSRAYTVILWGILFGLCIQGMKAQQPVSFTSDTGLSNTCIRSITEDSRKNVWICTQGGLNRYDGAKMNVYRHNRNVEGALGHDMVSCVLEVEPGCVLVGLENGVQAYSYDTDKFTDVPLITVGGGTVPAHIISMSRLSDGNVYVSTAGYGLYRLQKVGTELVLNETTDVRKEECNVLQIFEDRNGRVWTLYTSGTVYCREGGRTQRVAIVPDMVRLCQSSSGKVYLATLGGGLLCWSEQTRKFECVSEESKHWVIASVSPGKEGEVFVSTDGCGLWVYNEMTGTVSQSPIRTYEFNMVYSNVKAAMVDSEGNTWVGVYWKGVWVTPYMAPGFEYVGRRSVQKNTLGTNSVTAITSDGNGKLWVATDHCGVYHLEADGSASVHFKPGEVKSMPSTVISLLVDSEGSVWVGAPWTGLSKMNPVTGECTNIGKWVGGGHAISSVYAMVEDGFGRIWIGTGGNGLFCYNLKTNRLEHYRELKDNAVVYPYCVLHNPYVMALLVQGDNIYVGTAEGLDVLTMTPSGIKATGVYLRQATVRAMKMDAYGMLWVATTVGLVRFDVSDGSSVTYTSEDGLPSSAVNSLEISPEGRIWVGTDAGLSCFNPLKETFENYHIGDGLQGNEFTAQASCSMNGRMYFGGINGLTYFRSSDVGKRGGTRKTDLRLVDFYINGRRVHADDRSGRYTVMSGWLPEVETVNLAHGENSFAIELSTMSFINSNVTYHYCVNNSAWMTLEHGQNRISMVNMEPGTYRIRVKAEVYGGESDVRELTVVVHAPLLLSPLMRWVYFILFLFLCYVVYRQVDEHIKAKRTLENHRRTEELNEARVQFFMNISHEIRTPMTLILSPLAKLMRMDSDEAHQRNYSLIYQNSQRILRLINQLMDARKIEKRQFRLDYRKVELVGFINNLYELFETTASNRGITFEFVHAMERLDVCIDPQNFDKVVMNLLSNAFKFTPDGGRITVELCDVEGETEGEHDFLLTVTDTGTGIVNSEKKHVFDRFYSGKWEKGYVGTGIGLNLTRSLVELHAGHIWVEDNPDARGSRFVVRMPKALQLLEDITDEVMPEASDIMLPDADHVVETLEEISDGKKGGKHGTVMVVDDEVSIRRYVHGELSARYNVVECGNGKEAWDYIMQNVGKVDLVVSDIMMPVMDGAELCKKLKDNYNTNHIPVVMLTAKGDDNDRLAGLAMGADAYLSKPFNVDILKQTVENLLQSRRKLQGKFGVMVQEEEKVVKIDLASPDDKLMERVMKVINENLSNPDLSIELIADKIGMSRVHFHRKLKGVTSLTPRDFVRNIRLKEAARLLGEKKYDITDVSIATGFRSVSTFSTVFKAFYGMTPTEYMRKKAQEKKDAAEAKEA